MAAGGSSGPGTGGRAAARPRRRPRRPARLSDGVVQALIGAVAVVLAAVIAGGFAVWTAGRPDAAPGAPTLTHADAPPSTGSPGTVGAVPGSGAARTSATPVPPVATNIVVTPGRVRAGDTVTVTGTGFPPGARVRVTRGPDLTREVISGADGAFEMTFVATREMCCGPKIIFADSGTARAFQNVHVEQ